MRQPRFATIACAIGLGLTVQASMAQAALEDTLYDKGLLTKEEWVKTKADQERREAIIQQSPRPKNGMKYSAYAAIPSSVIISSPMIKNLASEYDSSIGNNTGFLVRRARIVISGDIHERVSLYLQTDFGGTPPPGTTNTSNNQNFAQLRDAYADVFLTKDKEWHIREGISKVPFGFEVLQSSQ